MSDAEAQQTVTQFFHQRIPEFYATGIEKLDFCYNKCLDLLRETSKDESMFQF